MDDAPFQRGQARRRFVTGPGPSLFENAGEFRCHAVHRGGVQALAVEQE